VILFTLFGYVSISPRRRSQLRTYPIANPEYSLRFGSTTGRKDGCEGAPINGRPQRVGIGCSTRAAPDARKVEGMIGVRPTGKSKELVGSRLLAIRRHPGIRPPVPPSEFGGTGGCASCTRPDAPCSSEQGPGVSSEREIDPIGPENHSPAAIQLCAIQRWQSDCPSEIA
jgi:hypothetical protein